jgi:TatD DNase family protein
METPFIDVHSHLKGTPGKGIIRVISFFPDQVAELTDFPPYFTAGIHPWHSGDQSSCEDFFQGIAGLPNFIGIGEIGLDRMVGPGVERQVNCFMRQAEMAEKLGKPVTIHCVRAWDELISIRKKIQPVQPWIIHGYRGSADRAKRLLDEGLFLSFGTPILRPDPVLRESLKICSPDRLFLESDEEHAPIASLYHEASNIMEISVEDLKTYIAGNFNRVYGIAASA